MNRVCLSGRLAGPPRLGYTSGMAVAMLRLLVPGHCCSEIVAEVDCFAFYEVAAYLATWGEADARVSLDGRLYLDTFYGADGRARRQLCVHIDQAAFLDPPRPTSPPVPGAPPPSRTVNGAKPAAQPDKKEGQP